MMIIATENQLLELVLEHSGTITCEITPEVALWLLKLNTANRPLKQSRIDYLVGEIEHQKWVNTGEPIIVSREGVLNDGQHRLEAIVRAGRAVEVDIRFGVRRSAFAVTGTGSRRDNPDVLAIAGVVNASRMAAMLKLWVQHSQPAWPQNISELVPAHVVLAALDAHPVAVEVARLGTAMRLPPLRASWFSFVLLLAAEAVSFDKAAEFARAVQDGGGEKSSGAQLLRERLVHEAMSRSKLRAIDKIILGIKAWNGWVEHRAMGVLKVVDTERTRAGFPRVSRLAGVRALARVRAV